MGTTTAAGQNESTRRMFLEMMALAGGGLGAGALLAGCAQEVPQGPASGSRRRLRAAFSNGGLQSTWCTLGKQTAELWGNLLDVDIEWIDGEFSAERQRNKIDNIVFQDWDFCCFQAVQTDSLAAPVRKLKERSIPVISMDTLLVPMDKMRESGVWIEIAADQIFMGESSSRYMFEKIGGKGKVIHIGGLSAHSGAQGRRQGFENARKDFPDVEVIGGGVRWCDWKKEIARNTFEALLSQEKDPIAGAFFHSDDMALACLPALKDSIHHKMVVTAVDGQKEGLLAVREGQLAATTVNPVCLIHQTSLIVGQFIVRNQEPVDSLPLEIVTPGPLVSLERKNILDAMFYLSDPQHCMV
ncbi:MAG TPA: sugar ABC transporter substrate-binding protein [Planctomycetaceae bacterium]|nr:sugar ABC transporter substrate-binding protein [Planctomycetaceae bacterium]